MKKKNNFWIILAFALFAFAMTMQGALADEWTTTPADSTYQNTAAITITCQYVNLTGGIGNNITNITLYNNFNGTWVANYTNSSISTLNNSVVTFYSTFTAERSSTWLCQALNSTNNIISNSTLKTRIYDATNPSNIKLTFDKTSVMKTQSFIATGSADDTNGISTYRYILFNPTGDVVVERSGSTATFTSADFGNIIGAYTIKGNATDPASNTGSSETYTISINSGSGAGLPDETVENIVAAKTTGQPITPQTLVGKTAISPMIVIWVLLGLGVIIVVVVVGIAMSQGKKKGKRRR